MHDSGATAAARGVSAGAAAFQNDCINFDYEIDSANREIEDFGISVVDVWEAAVDQSKTGTEHTLRDKRRMVSSFLCSSSLFPLLSLLVLCFRVVLRSFVVMLNVIPASQTRMSLRLRSMLAAVQESVNVLMAKLRCWTGH